MQLSFPPLRPLLLPSSLYSSPYSPTALPHTLCPPLSHLLHIISTILSSPLPLLPVLDPSLLVYRLNPFLFPAPLTPSPWPLPPFSVPLPLLYSSHHLPNSLCTCSPFLASIPIPHPSLLLSPILLTLQNLSCWAKQGFHASFKVKRIILESVIRHKQDSKLLIYISLSIPRK